MTLTRGSSVVAVDAHALDRAGGRALARTTAARPRTPARSGSTPRTATRGCRARSRRWCRRRRAACTSSPRCGPSCSTAAAVSAPTWPAMHGSTCRCASGRSSSMSSAHASTGSSVASVNGAVPSGVGIDAEHEVMHDRVADEHDVERRGRARRPLRLATSSPTTSSSAAADRVGELAPRRRRASSRTRRGSSGPRRSGSAGS